MASATFFDFGGATCGRLPAGKRGFVEGDLPTDWKLLYCINEAKNHFFRIFRIHQVTMNTDLSKLFRTKKQNIRSRCFWYVLTKSGCKIILFGVADHNEFFSHSKILIQQILAILKIALTTLVENKEIRAGIITIIGDNKICKITVGNRFTYSKFWVIEMRTLFSLLKTFIAAATTWRNREGREIVNCRIPLLLPNALCNAATISSGTPTKRHNAHFHFARFPLRKSRFLKSHRIRCSTISSRQSFFSASSWSSRATSFLSALTPSGSISRSARQPSFS